MGPNLIIEMQNVICENCGSSSWGFFGNQEYVQKVKCAICGFVYSYGLHIDYEEDNIEYWKGQMI